MLLQAMIFFSLKVVGFYYLSVYVCAFIAVDICAWNLIFINDRDKFPILQNAEHISLSLFIHALIGKIGRNNLVCQLILIRRLLIIILLLVDKQMHLIPFYLLYIFIYSTFYLLFLIIITKQSLFFCYWQKPPLTGGCT